MRALLAAGDKLAARMQIIQRLQIQARERGDSTIELNAEEIFDASDRAALEAWETAKASALGAQPLPYLEAM